MKGTRKNHWFLGGQDGSALAYGCDEFRTELLALSCLFLYENIQSLPQGLDLFFVISTKNTQKCQRIFFHKYISQGCILLFILGMVVFKWKMPSKVPQERQGVHHVGGGTERTLPSICFRGASFRSASSASSHSIQSVCVSWIQIRNVWFWILNGQIAWRVLFIVFVGFVAFMFVVFQQLSFFWSFWFTVVFSRKKTTTQLGEAWTCGFTIETRSQLGSFVVHFWVITSDF